MARLSKAFRQMMKDHVKNLPEHKHTDETRAILAKVKAEEAREALEAQKQVSKDEVLKAIMQVANLDTDISQLHQVKDFIIKTLEDKLHISNKLEELTKQHEELKSSYEQDKISLANCQTSYQNYQSKLLPGELNNNEELEL